MAVRRESTVLAKGSGSPREAFGGLALRIAGAMFMVGPAVIHFAVAPDQLLVYPLYGILFVLLGLIQIGLAIGIVVRPSPTLLLGGTGLSLAVIAVWLLSRTTGLPIAPVPWRPEAVGLPDLMATYMEWAAAGLLVMADFRLGTLRSFRVSRVVPGLTIAALLSVGMTLAGLAAVSSGGSH